jgi:hypothetical protein
MGLHEIIKEEAEIKFNNLYDEVLENINVLSNRLEISDNAVCLVAASVLFDQFGDCCSDVRHSSIDTYEQNRIISFTERLEKETESLSDCMVLLSRAMCIVVSNMIYSELENEKTKK